MKLDVVFMGTPDFALPVLEALCDNFNVILCVTKADKPKGRGGKVTKSPVKIEAEKRGIPVLSPEKVKTPEFLYDPVFHELSDRVIRRHAPDTFYLAARHRLPVGYN